MDSITVSEPVSVVDVLLKGVSLADVDALELVLKHGVEAVRTLPLASNGPTRAEPYLSETQLKFVSQLRAAAARVRGTLDRKDKPTPEAR